MKEISIKRFYKYYYIIVLVLLIKQYLDHLLLHQFCMPIFKFPSIDNTYWVFYLLQIPQFISTNENTLILFDSILILFNLACIFTINQVWITRLFFILFFIYFICVNSFSGHHSHMLIGILLGNLIFCSKSINIQLKNISMLRYYLMFLMSSAAVWKITRGSIFTQDHLSNILFNQNIYENYLNNKHLHSFIIQYLIDNQSVSHLLYLLATMVELSFIIGFFTKKYDHFLIYLFILFFGLDYFLLNLNFIELSILLITLFPVKRT